MTKTNAPKFEPHGTSDHILVAVKVRVCVAGVFGTVPGVKCVRCGMVRANGGK